MQRIGLLLLILVILAVSACSSLPKQVQPQEKKNADLMLVSAQRYENHRQYIDAKAMYELLLNNYRGMGDVEGQLVALAGLSRICLTSDTAQYHVYLSQMSELIDVVDTHKSYHIQTLELYRLYLDAKWDSLALTAVPKDTYPGEANMQILSYKVQADAYLQNLQAADLAYLERLYSRYLRKIRSRKFSHPEAVSNAAYSLAYSYMLSSDLQKADKYLKHALQIDYAYGLFYSYAYDLWLEGQIAVAQGNNGNAIASLTKARDIFATFTDTRMQDKISKDLEQLTERK